MNEMPDIASILNMINGMKPSDEKQTETSKENNSFDVGQMFSGMSFSENSNMPDVETMLKIMKVMNAVKSGDNSPGANLLNSLKPFLRDSKKEKLDQYIKFMKISSVISEMNNEENNRG